MDEFRPLMDGSLLAALLLLAASIVKAAFALKSRSDVQGEQIKNLTADHERLERDWTDSVKEASEKRGELYSRISESETSMRQEIRELRTHIDTRLDTLIDLVHRGTKG